MITMFSCHSNVLRFSSGISCRDSIWQILPYSTWKAVAIVIAVMMSFVANAANIQNIGCRKTTSLDGQWNAIVDPYNHGFYHRFQLDLPFDGKGLSDYDFDTSETLRVPGDWNTQRENLMMYEGRVWYRTKFSYALPKGKRLFLYFAAANYEATVWINGKEIGRHTGGFTPFQFDITDNIRNAADDDKTAVNSLVVCVDDTRQPGGIPTMNTDWWNYGGLTRSVSLIETNETFVNDYSVGLSGGYVQLNDSKAEQKITVEIPELKYKKLIITDEQGRATFSLGKKRPQLWTPESPKLYDVRISYGDEQISDRVGFRTIAVKGRDILLNGKPIFLCGVNIHEECKADKASGRTNRRITSIDEDRELLAMAKELGCNFVRLAHYPHNEEMLKAADEMGMLVWSEIPLYWGIDWNNKETYKLAEQQLAEMIDRDHNRASVIIWSIANETAVNKERTDFLTRLANKARTLDDTRLISAALQNVNKRLTPTTYTVEDPLKDALDIFSYNEYIGWYDAPKEFCDSITWQLDTDKPVVISEFGGGAKLGRHGKVGEFFCEENLVELYRHQFTMLRKIPGLAGTIPWVLMDFRSPHRLLRGIQDGYNRKGLYSEYGEKKAAWQIVKDWNTEHAAR